MRFSKKMKFNIDIPYSFINDDDCEIVIHIDDDGKTLAVNKASKSSSFYKYIKSCIEKLQGMGRVRTAESYQSTLNSFRKFMLGKDVFFEDITPDLMRNYQTFLTASGIVLNTVSFYMRILRTVYLNAVRAGLAKNNHPFDNVYTGISKTAKRAISAENVKEIYSFKSMNSSLMFARAMFLFSFYTRGMSFVDIAKLKKTDVRDGFLSYQRSKTKQTLKMAWTREMQEIADQYPSKDGLHLLNILNEKQRMPVREQFKKRQASLNYFLKKLGRLIGIRSVLTMYVARHSWASIAKQMNVPISIISDGMGHSSERTTQVYLTSIDACMIDKANSEIIHSITGE